MLYSRNTQYAIRALTRLAVEPRGAVLSTRQIARAERIAVASLAKVMKVLARARMVRPGRGRKGGYSLVADPRTISLWRVMIQFDDPADFRTCGIGLGGCSDARPCLLHPYWKEARSALESFLRRVRISHLAAVQMHPRARGRRAGRPRAARPQNEVVTSR